MIEKKGMEQQGQNPWPELTKTLQQKRRKNLFPFPPVSLSQICFLTNMNTRFNRRHLEVLQ